MEPVGDALHPSINIHHDIMCAFEKVVYPLTVLQGNPLQYNRYTILWEDWYRHFCSGDFFTDRLTSINFFTRNTINQLRDTVWAMNKDAIKFEDLIDRISNHISQAGQLVGTRITFKNEIDEAIEFSALVGINVFRIMQEAINNAIKYADAELVIVEIKLIDGGYELSITDDGNGFDIDKTDQGNGIRNMMQRSAEIDGKLIIDSKVNHGTTITLFIDHPQDLGNV